MAEDRPDEGGGEELLALGYVSAAHGIAGGLRIKLFDPDLDEVPEGAEVELRRDGSVCRRVVRRVASHPGADRIRLWLEGVDDRNAAEALKGNEIWIDRQALPPLEDDEYYLADAVGLAVEREHDGARQSLGVVVGVSSNGVQDLFEVEWQSPGRGARTWLLPALPQFVVAFEDEVLVCEVPEGFLPTELEAP